jgi:hypothetical protein
MAFKSQYSMSRDAFDGLLTAIGSLLPEDHVMPKCMYEAQKLVRVLKMTYEQIHACPKGCVLFRKEYAEAKYYSKCKSSRFMEVESGWFSCSRRHMVASLAPYSRPMLSPTRARRRPMSPTTRMTGSRHIATPPSTAPFMTTPPWHRRSMGQITI